MDHHFGGELAGLLLTFQEHSLDLIVVLGDVAQGGIGLSVHTLNLFFDARIRLGVMLHARGRVVKHAANLGQVITAHHVLHSV